MRTEFLALMDMKSSLMRRNAVYSGSEVLSFCIMKLVR